MRTLLVINASGRLTRSITHRLTGLYTQGWLQANPEGRVIERDVGRQPPPAVNEAWIAGAFADPVDRTEEMRAALDLSEALIGELEVADEIVLGVPMYNFGMPGQLKTYFDQIIRVNRTFAIDQQAEDPYTPLLTDRPVTIIMSVGDGTLLPGGRDSHLNFLEPHLNLLLSFIGFHNLRHVRVGYEEYQDERLMRSLESAEALIHELAGAEPAVLS